MPLWKEFYPLTTLPADIDSSDLESKIRDISSYVSIPVSFSTFPRLFPPESLPPLVETLNIDVDIVGKYDTLSNFTPLRNPNSSLLINTNQTLAYLETHSLILPPYLVLCPSISIQLMIQTQTIFLQSYPIYQTVQLTGNCNGSSLNLNLFLDAF